MSGALAGVRRRFSRSAPSPPGSSSRSTLADAAALGVIAACALILHRDGLLGGPAFYELDTRLFYFPLAQWVGQQLHQGTYPLWLPGIFTGYPIFADGELGLAYLPQTVLLYLLPAPMAMVWLRVLHAFLAGLFMYLFSRTLRLSPPAALGGALVFAFGSFLTAQLHHENVVRSAVWLPAVLASLERARRASTRSSLAAWSAVGALAFAQSALGLHVQPVLMLGLTTGIYALIFGMLPGASPLRGLASAVAIGAGGMLIAAVQWLPLGEWALASSRRGGVDYEFASAFALSPQNLPTLIFPFFFRLPDATTWWTLWQQWETELYVGIPTLALALVGLVFARRVELIFFVLLAAAGLLIGLAGSAPFFNLHQFLWALPGFSFLRAPGRFSYLFVFALAGLAAFGLQALAQRRLRILVALLGGLPSVVAVAALLALLPAWRAWLLADPSRATSFVSSAYLAARAQYPIDPQLVLGGLLSSLELGTPKTAWSLVLLTLTSMSFVVWFGLGHQRASIGQALFVGLLAVDLLVFASDFHPSAPLASLMPALPPGLTAGDRLVLRDASDLPALEPDQLLGIGLSTAQGYSSLPSQRHLELEASASAQPSLLDLWAAPFVLEPTNPPDLHEVDGVRFRSDHPLVAAFGGGVAASFRAPPGLPPAQSVRLIGTLSYAYNVTQGQPVASLTVGTLTLPLRAGIEFSERAFDRPSLKGLVQHQKAHVALDFEEATPQGEDYTAHLYEAELPLTLSGDPQTFTFTALDPGVLVEIEGIATVDAAGAPHSLDLADREGFQRVSEQVIRNTRALPRAYVLPRTQSFSPARHPGLTPTQLVANADVDLHTMLFVEGDPATSEQPSGSRGAVAATRIDDLGPMAVRVTVNADAPSYLVLADSYARGWTAEVDGEGAKIYIANALFRAVALEPGPHVVDFRFQPLSIVVGAAVSAASLLVALTTIGFGYARSRTWHRRRPDSIQ